MMYVVFFLGMAWEALIISVLEYLSLRTTSPGNALTSAVLFGLFALLFFKLNHGGRYENQNCTRH